MTEFNIDRAQLVAEENTYLVEVAGKTTALLALIKELNKKFKRKLPNRITIYGDEPISAELEAVYNEFPDI